MMGNSRCMYLVFHLPGFFEKNQGKIQKIRKIRVLSITSSGDFSPLTPTLDLYDSILNRSTMKENWKSTTARWNESTKNSAVSLGHYTNGVPYVIILLSSDSTFIFSSGNKFNEFQLNLLNLLRFIELILVAIDRILHRFKRSRFNQTKAGINRTKLDQNGFNIISLERM